MKKLLQKIKEEPDALLQKIIRDPMGDNTIHYYLPNARILTFKELDKYNSIEELLPSNKSYCIILFESEPECGHWTAIMTYDFNGEKVYENFCSYGTPIEGQRKWSKFYEGLPPYLINLFNKATSPVIYNTTDYQNKKGCIATCGRHVCSRLKYMLGDYNLTNYNLTMDVLKEESHKSYDEIVATIIDKL